MNLGDGLRINSWLYPNKTAVVFEDKRLTYAELNRRANQLAHAMIRKGFERQDKVALLMHNNLEFIEMYNGLARIGVISVPVNFRLVEKEIAYIIDNSDSTGLIVGEDLVGSVDFKSLPNLKKENVFVVGSQVPAGLTSYADLLAGMPDTEPAVELSEADIFYFGYTSGTTGFPKGALIKTRNTLEVVRNAIQRNAGRKSVDMTQRVFLAIMPLCHSNSIWATLITLWMGGTNVVFPSGKFDPEKVLATIAREKVTTSSMVPTMLVRILELPDEVRGNYDMSSLSSLGSSSAPLHTKTKEAALEFFRNASFSEGYGSTETGAVSTLRHKDQKRKVRSIGQPNPGLEVKLIDEEGNLVTEPGKVGILWVRTPAAFAGYYKDPQKTQEAINGEWVTAGDMAFRDEEGFLFLADRKSDMIISGGENIYPREIEEVVALHPAVSEVAVIGIPHERWGEEVKAIVSLKEGATATQDEILDFCKEHLAGYKRPRTVDFVDEFPKTATGKILKRIVKQKYWEGQERMI
ncbi:MAG: long-chain-fatty-acid--CoA ligase [Deltaproteobacteria bacterium]|nr:long-chain-fatty-acid--CoA ligase [Deltaproteobacteria bacterium]